MQIKLSILCCIEIGQHLTRLVVYYTVSSPVFYFAMFMLITIRHHDNYVHAYKEIYDEWTTYQIIHASLNTK